MSVQIMLPFNDNPWIIVNKGDDACRQLVDRHYTRQSPGDKQFCRPGRNLVLRTPMGDAVWVTWNGIRDDGLDAWECTLFRNESEILSSKLIKEAVKITYQSWGEPPQDGIITYIAPDKVTSVNPGYCFKCAGWISFGKSKSGKIRLRIVNHGTSKFVADPTALLGGRLSPIGRRPTVPPGRTVSAYSGLKVRLYES